MNTYQDRYLAGHHVAVWDELQLAGSTIFEESTYSDALVVAREMMRRVYLDLVQLQVNWKALGFRFGITHFTPLTCFSLEDEFRAPAPFREADERDRARLSELEATCGPLPLSARAWYERIGSVNFVGIPPECSDLETSKRTASERALSATADRAFQEAIQLLREQPDAVDPLWINPMPSAHALTHRSNDTPLTINLCPDAPVKGGIPGGISYQLTTSPLAADGWVESERWRIPFVRYLRHAILEWAGFPGLGELLGLSSEIMNPLTENLIAF